MSLSIRGAEELVWSLVRELVLSPPGLFELIQNYMWYIYVINYTGIFATGFLFLSFFFFKYSTHIGRIVADCTYILSDLSTSRLHIIK